MKVLDYEKQKYWGANILFIISFAISLIFSIGFYFLYYQKELAGKLNISVNTVKFHLKNIYQITGVSNLTSLLNILHEFTSSGQ